MPTTDIHSLAGLRAHREAAGLSRQALAEAAGGISLSTIWRIEHNEGRPHRSTLRALARVLDCDPLELAPNEREAATNGPARKAENDGPVLQHQV